MLKTYHDYANAIETNQFRISNWYIGKTKTNYIEKIAT